MVYHEKFEELRAVVLLKYPGLSESSFVSNFLSGLQDELKALVKMHKPRTLQEVFETTRWQEKASEMIMRKNKGVGKYSFPPHIVRRTSSAMNKNATLSSQIPSEKLVKKRPEICFPVWWG